MMVFLFVCKSDNFVCLLTFVSRKSDMILVPSLHSKWDKKRLKKAEQKSVKTFENELKENAKRQREVCQGLMLKTLKILFI